MSTFSLGAGPDVIVGTSGDDTVNGTSSTLNAGDSLDGGAGHDTLALFGSGTFDLSSLAQFTGFEEVDLTDLTGGQSNLTLASGSDLTLNIDNENGNGGTINLADGAVTLNLSAAGYYYNVYASTGTATINDAGVNNSITLSTGDAAITFTGGNTSNGDYIAYVSSGKTIIDASNSVSTVQVYLDNIGALDYDDVFTASTQIDEFSQPVASYLYAEASGELDLTRLTLNNQWYLYLNTSNVTIDVDAASLSHLKSINNSSFTTGNQLQTAAAALDLTQISVNNLAIASTNATGTTFTVANATTGLEVQGGPGNDTLIGQGFAFTAGQRAVIFAQGSVETIQDTSGTYIAPDFVRSPADADPAANSVAEGAAFGSATGLTASAEYHFGDTVTYSITADASGGGFAVDPTTGIVTVADSSKIDYESSGGSYQLTVQANDGALAATQNFTIAVADVAPAVPTDSDAAANSVLEGAATGTLVGITASSSDVNGGALTYGIASDSSGGAFAIDPTTGVVTVADPGKINYTASGGSYQLTVQATDGVLTSAETFAIDVNHRQPPVVTASGTITPASGQVPVAIDPTIAVSDADTATLASASVAITGGFQSGEDLLAFANNDAPAFGNIAAAYAPDSGVLSLSSAGDTATVAQWQAALEAVTYADTSATPVAGDRTVSFQVDNGQFSDHASNSASDAVHVIGPMSPANSTLTVIPTTLTANGISTTAIQFVAEDSEGFSIPGASVTFSSTGTGDTFSSHSGTTDANGTIIVTLASTSSGTDTVSATLGGTSEAATVVFVAGPVSQAASSITANPATLLDDGVSSTTLTVTLRDAFGNPVAGAALSLSASGSDNIFTPPSGTSDADGVFVATLSSTDPQTETITALEAGGSESTPVTFTAPNQPPVITSASLASEPENTLASHVVYTASATDPDGDPVAFALTGDDAGKFSIDPASGQVRFLSSPDYENPGSAADSNSYQLVLHANDGLHDVTQQLVIDVTDVAGVTITGTSGNDTLTGTSEVDTIHALGGKDTLAGLGGADLLDGGPGTDTATYAASPAGVNVSLATGLGHGGDAEGDTLVNIENLTGSSFNDTLEGDGGNNTLIGGSGTDTVSYANAAAGVTVNLGITAAQDTGGAGSDTLKTFENITGSAFDDVLTGSGASNVLSGGGGDDLLSGLGGNNTLIGGPGDDTYVLTSKHDVIVENPGEGSDTVQASFSYVLGANLENLTLTGSASNTATGNGENNILIGNSGDNILAGLGGADTLVGGGGTDTATYAASPSGVNVSLATGLGYGGDAEGDTLSNIQNLTGSAFDDTLEGNSGNNVLTGGNGLNTLSYANASAGVTVNLATSAAQDTVGAGIDTATGFKNLTGSAFNDVLAGSGSINVLVGGGGDDILTGGNGADTLTGGAGSDTFVYTNAVQSTGSGYDTITDFDALEDKFKLAFAVPALNATVTTGSLSDASFDSDLAAALGTGQLSAHHAVLFDPSSGSLAGQSFLVIDANNHAGYQAGADLVIRLSNPANLSSLAVANFTH